MKKLTTLAAAALALAMTGAGALAETTIQLGTTVNEQDSFQVAAEKFAELVEERTNGEYKIEIYPNGTLGGESDMLDSMSTGMLDMGIITSGPFVNFSEAMGVLDMPYLFANNEEAYKVFDGEIGRELLDSLEDAGLKGLAYAERGFRNVTNSVRPVNNADDLAGLKLRVMENEVYTATFKALKVNAVPMAWAEALTAMQQGIIEGEENPINVIYSYSLWDYGQKYVTLDRHSYSTAIITMSLDVFNSLDEATLRSSWRARRKPPNMSALGSPSRRPISWPPSRATALRLSKIRTSSPSAPRCRACTTLIRSTRTTSPAFRRCWPSNSAVYAFPLPRGEETFFYPFRIWEKRRHPPWHSRKSFPPSATRLIRCAAWPSSSCSA